MEWQYIPSEPTRSLSDLKLKYLELKVDKVLSSLQKQIKFQSC